MALKVVGIGGGDVDKSVWGTKELSVPGLYVFEDVGTWALVSKIEKWRVRVSFLMKLFSQETVGIHLDYPFLVNSVHVGLKNNLKG